MNAIRRVLSLPAVTLSRIPFFAPLIRVLSTSIGQKLLMAVTGLSLCGFLVAHLGGNLLLFSGKQAYNDYAHMLHSREGLLMIAETGLFGVFVLHLALAISTSAMSAEARRIEYDEKETKQGIFLIPGGGAASWMMQTGLIVLVFLVVHLLDFKLESNPTIDYASVSAAGEDGGTDPFDKAVLILQSPSSALIYVLGCAALGVHLVHGFASAFQTLGLCSKKWSRCIKWLGTAFGVVIALGFIGCVVWAWAFQ